MDGRYRFSAKDDTRSWNGVSPGNSGSPEWPSPGPGSPPFGHPTPDLRSRKAQPVPAMLEVTDVGHRFGSGPRLHTAIDSVSFTVNEGELVCIVGPSGCGKSTLLRSVAGLLRPTSGTIRLHGDPVVGVPPDLAVVFQDYSRSLFPWLTVLGNVQFPLHSRGLTRSERKARAAEALDWVGLAGTGRKYPWQLSGGMQQRVALARALAYRPSLMLMDEPFASVDAQTRADLEDLLLRVRREHQSTVLLVTHDIDESVYL